MDGIHTFEFNGVEGVAMSELFCLFAILSCLDDKGIFKVDVFFCFLMFVDIPLLGFCC